MNKYLINLISDVDVEALQYVSAYLNDTDSPLHYFMSHWHIGNGEMQNRRRQLQSVISRIIDVENNDSPLLLHFLGHGVRDGSGIEFISYDSLNDMLMPLAIHHQLYNTCYSSGMLNQECYKGLMYTNGEVNDIYSPFKVYENEDYFTNIDSFELFTRQNQTQHLYIDIK